MEESADRMRQYFALTFAALFTFTITNLMLAQLLHGWQKHKGNSNTIAQISLEGAKSDGNWKVNSLQYEMCASALIGFAGVVTPLLSIATGMGGLLHAGIQYSDVAGVVPFLIISIGVDDVFIIASSYRIYSNLSPKARLRAALAVAAPSITVTSLTDALAFAAGTLTNIPAVRQFSAMASVCVLIDFVYQVTFFAACLYVVSRFDGCSVNRGDANKVSTQSDNALTHKVHHQISENTENGSKLTNYFMFLETYVNLLRNNVTRIVIAVIYVLYVSIGIFGCAQVHEGMTVKQLMPNSHYSHAFLEEQEKYMDQGTQVDVIFNNAPSLVSTESRVNVLKVVKRCESLPHTFDREGTQFFLLAYKDFMNSTGSYLSDTDDVWIYGLMEWAARQAFYPVWGKDMLWVEDPENPGKPKLLSFRLRIGLKCFEAECIRDSAQALREIADEFPQYNITTFHLFRHYADQMLSVKQTTLQALLIAITSMAVISILFVPAALGIVVMLLAVFSIDLGVIGCLFLWHTALDPVSMTTILMSIGFSVDFSMHIVHGMCVTSHSSANEDTAHISQDVVANALLALGWPVLQGGVSTMLGVSVLAFIDTYIVQVFFRTVFLVISFGCLHALVFLPCLMGALPTHWFHSEKR